jgi:arylsulfatase A-like enzyme
VGRATLPRGAIRARFAPVKRAIDYAVSHGGAVVGVLTACLLLSSASCEQGGEATGVDSPRLPNVLLLTLDTLRADHLGCYGYQRKNSPQIDAFAEVATLFPRAYAAASWTLPSHASLFTGKYPAEHGARTFKREDGRAWEGALDESQLTLAEALKAEGYRTAAFVGNTVYLKPRFRLDQGFDSYFNERTYARTLTRLVVEWLQEHQAAGTEDPFFLFANYVDTHNPYNVGKRRDDPGFLEEGKQRNSYPLYEELRPWILQRKEPFPGEKLQLLIDQYDTSIYNLDAELGFLFQSLEQLGLYDDTLIVLTSDHGEFFGEHELIDHGKDLYQEVLRVPLIVKYPGQREGRVDDTLVSGVHVPQLVVSQLPRRVAERNLRHFPRAPGRGAVLGENYFTMPYDFNRNPWERERFDRVRTAFYEWPYKYIRDSTGAHELYDLEQDPGETVNLYDREPKVAQRLAARLEAHEAASRRLESALPASAPTVEEIENLRALGYLPAEPDGAETPE